MPGKQQVSIPAVWFEGSKLCPGGWSLAKCSENGGHAELPRIRKTKHVHLSTHWPTFTVCCFPGGSLDARRTGTTPSGVRGCGAAMCARPRGCCQMSEFMRVLHIGLTAESPFLCVGKCTRLLPPSRRLYVASAKVPMFVCGRGLNRITRRTAAFWAMGGAARRNERIFNATFPHCEARRAPDRAPQNLADLSSVVEDIRGKITHANNPTRNQTGLFVSPRSLRRKFCGWLSGCGCNCSLGALVYQPSKPKSRIH